MKNKNNKTQDPLFNQAGSSLEELQGKMKSVLDQMLPGMKDVNKYIENFTPISTRKGRIYLKAQLVERKRTFWDKLFRRHPQRLDQPAMGATIVLNKPMTIVIELDDKTMAENLYNELTQDAS